MAGGRSKHDFAPLLSIGWVEFSLLDRDASALAKTRKQKSIQRVARYFAKSHDLDISVSVVMVDGGWAVHVNKLDRSTTLIQPHVPGVDLALAMGEEEFEVLN